MLTSCVSTNSSMTPDGVIVSVSESDVKKKAIRSPASIYLYSSCEITRSQNGKVDNVSIAKASLLSLKAEEPEGSEEYEGIAETSSLIPSYNLELRLSTLSDGVKKLTLSVKRNNKEIVPNATISVNSSEEIENAHVVTSFQAGASTDDKKPFEFVVKCSLPTEEMP